jgi:hypothetical protein
MARLTAGTRGMKPRARAELLERAEGHIEEIRHNLIVEIKKLTQLHEQVDEVRLAIRELKGGAK